MSERAWNWERQLRGIIPPPHLAAGRRGHAPVLAGVMLPTTEPAVEAARRAAGEGADALVVGSPCYFGVEPAAQERHVEAVLAATPLPALLQKRLAIKRDRPHFRVRQGHESLAAASLLQGGDGMVPGMANLAPAAPAAREAIAALLDEVGLGTVAGATRAR